MSANGDFDSETVYGKPVQVISIDENENTFSLNEEGSEFSFIQDTCKNEIICCQRCWRFSDGKILSVGFFKIFTLSTKQNGRGSME